MQARVGRGAFTMVINRQRASSHMQQLRGTDPPNKRAPPCEFCGSADFK